MERKEVKGTSMWGRAFAISGSPPCLPWCLGRKVGVTEGDQGLLYRSGNGDDARDRPPGRQGLRCLYQRLVCVAELEQCRHGHTRDYCIRGRTRHSHISPKVEKPKNLSDRGRGQPCWNSWSSPALVSRSFACHCHGQLFFNPVHCALE